MCSYCFGEEYSSFFSHDEFESFEIEFNKKVEKKIIIYKGKGGSDWVEGYLKYKCTHCSQIWCLSVPNYAWRGYFLKNVNVKQKLNEFNNDREEKKLSFIYFLLVVLLIVLLAKFL